MHPGKSRIEALDWLRAFAVVSVLIQHAVWKSHILTTFSGPLVAANTVHAVVRLGLPMFFIISGYLLIKPYPTARSILDFYKKRAARILPSALAWSYIFFVIQQKSLDPLLFLQTAAKGPTAYHLWFLYTIIGLYIITPFVSNILTAAKSEHVIAFVVASFALYSLNPLLAFLGINGALFGVFQFSFAMYFLAGHALRRMVQENRPTRCPLPLLLGAMIAATFVLSFFRANGFAPYDQSITMLAACGALFLLVMRRNPPTTPTVRFLSAKSFGIYFSHPIFIWIFDKYAGALNPYLDMVLCAAFTLACAAGLELALDLARRAVRQAWRR